MLNGEILKLQPTASQQCVRNCSIPACSWLCITTGKPHKDTPDPHHATTCGDSPNCPDNGNRVVHLSGFTTPNLCDDI